MAHPMHSNSDDEVELNTPVPQLDQRTIPKSARDVWEVGRPASGFGQPIELRLVNGDQVWVWRADSSDLATMRFEGFEQQRSGFFHPWIIDQLGVMKGFRIVAQQGTYGRGGLQKEGLQRKSRKNSDSNTKQEMEPSRMVRKKARKPSFRRAGITDLADYTQTCVDRLSNH